MQTKLADFIRDTPMGREADEILRKCVHCGFCTATCPTYRILGDELDGPRGRIYLIKEMLEGEPVTARTQTHLDRCLTCRNCETTCPSGVHYGRLIDIGRHTARVRRPAPRPWRERLVRGGLLAVLQRRWLFTPLVHIGRAVRPLLPERLAAKIPAGRTVPAVPERRHPRRVILPEGCVQPAMMPAIDASTRRVLDRFGVEALQPGGAGCCGAIRHHLEQEEGALAQIKKNIDTWIPLLDDGAEAIVINASGCSVMIKEYGHLLRHDPAYAARAARVSAATRDLSEFAAALDMVQARPPGARGTVAFHPPCTLQHGQSIRGVVERLLTESGYRVVLPESSHLCCGSAGTYSVLQPELAMRLRDDKVAALEATGADLIASANIGCLAHLESGTGTPVRHWIELVDMAQASRSA